MTAFFLDAFSASRPSGFAETLSFLLEFLSFFGWVLNFSLEFFVFSVCSIQFLKNSTSFPIEQALYRYILNFCMQIWHFTEISAVFESIFVGFKKTKIGNLPKPWVFCLSFELFSWVLSFFILEFWVFSSLSFFRTVQKKKAGLKVYQYCK